MSTSTSTAQDTTTNPEHILSHTQVQPQDQQQHHQHHQQQHYRQHEPQDNDENNPGKDSDQVQPQDEDPEDQDQESRTHEARTAFTASLNAIGHNYDQPLRARAETLHEMETILRGQEEQVSSATAGLSRQNAEMEGTLDTAREGLKEIGDVQNWAELLERDLLVVEEVLRDVEGQDYESDVDAGAVGASTTAGAGAGSGAGAGGAGVAATGDSSGSGERDETRATGKKGWFKWW